MQFTRRGELLRRWGFTERIIQQLPSASHGVLATRWL